LIDINAAGIAGVWTPPIFNLQAPNQCVGPPPSPITIVFRISLHLQIYYMQLGWPGS